MILTLAVLDMVGLAQSGVNAEPCEFIGNDHYECANYWCPDNDCRIIECDGKSPELECGAS